MTGSVRVVETGKDEKGEPIEEVQFGGEYDGVFIPFVTKSKGYADHLADRARSEQESQTDDEPDDDEYT